MAGQSGGGGNGGGDSGMAVFVGLAIVLLLAGVWVFHTYEQHKAIVNQVFIWMIQLELLPFLPFSKEAQFVFYLLKDSPSGSFSFQQIEAGLNIGGSYARWLVLPIVLFGVFLRWKTMSWIYKYTRTFKMMDLMEHNSEFFPAPLKPIVNRKKSLLDEPPAKGPWRFSEAPMQFALKHGIITDGQGRTIPLDDCYIENGLPKDVPIIPESGLYFQPEVCEHVLLNRMGPPAPRGLPSLRKMPRYQVGLAGAFCAFALGKRKEGQRILDAMSISFNEDVAVQSQNKEGVPGDFPINILSAEAYIIRALKPRGKGGGTSEDNLATRLMKKASMHDEFVYAWLGALLEGAREKGGTLTPQQFIWLRPANRELWYFLNSLGGNACHNEAAAIWSHYRAETILGRSISTPVVQYGVMALKKSIESEGWMDIKTGQSWSDLRGL